MAMQSLAGMLTGQCLKMRLCSVGHQLATFVLPNPASLELKATLALLVSVRNRLAACDPGSMALSVCRVPLTLACIAGNVDVSDSTTLQGLSFHIPFPRK